MAIIKAENHELTVDIDERNYSIRGKMPNDAFSKNILPHKAIKNAENLTRAEIGLYFPANVPSIIAGELANARSRLGAMDNGRYIVAPNSEKLINDTLNGQYQLTTKTSDHRLKLEQPTRSWDAAGKKNREIEDDWKISIDPVTAHLLGFEADIDLRNLSEETTNILRQIDELRIQAGLTQKNIALILADKEKAKRRL